MALTPEPEQVQTPPLFSDLVFVFLLSLCARLSHQFTVMWYQGTPDHVHRIFQNEYSVFHDMDVVHYLYMAQSIVTEGWTSPFFHPPLTSFLIAGPVYLFGTFYAAKITFLFLGTLTPVLVYLTARNLIDHRIGFWAGILSALSFPLIYTSAVLNTECPAFFFLTLSIYLIGRIRENSGIFSFAAAGLAIGLGTLCRTEILFISVLAILFIRGKWKAPLFGVRTATFFVALILSLAPLMVHNYRAVGAWNQNNPQYPLSPYSPIGLNGPLNFLIGNNSFSNGGYSEDALGPLPKNKNLLETMDRNHRLIRNGYRMGWDFIRANPERIRTLVLSKLDKALDLFSFGFLNQNFPVGLDGIKRFGDSFSSRNTTYLAINAGFFLVGFGLVLFGRNGSCRLPLLFPIILVLLVTILFFGLVRIALLALPMILIFQAAVLQKIGAVLTWIIPNTGIKLIRLLIWVVFFWNSDL